MRIFFAIGYWSGRFFFWLLTGFIYGTIFILVLPLKLREIWKGYIRPVWTTYIGAGLILFGLYWGVDSYFHLAGHPQQFLKACWAFAYPAAVGRFLIDVSVIFPKWLAWRPFQKKLG